MDAAGTIAQFAKMLGNLDRWLEAGSAFAEKKKFEPDVLAQSRLAPDQYELVRQVQSACDAAKAPLPVRSEGARRIRISRRRRSPPVQDACVAY
jgi:hypothetical protein